MMRFQDEASPIIWRLHLNSSPADVYQMLATDAGRARFWAETAVAQNGQIHFLFPDGQTYPAEILKQEPPYLFRLTYFGSLVTFALAPDGAGGTDLTVTNEDVAVGHRCEVIAGWVSVLMALKGAVDFGVDLRNHDPDRTWQTGFADN